MASTSVRQLPERRRAAWTHRSVLALAPTSDPIDVITRIARGTVFKALQAGWQGPPYDPFSLAEILKISVEPRQDVIDARTTAGPSGKFRVEFNPNRSQARINFSVAHEIAHTFFPDCGEATRHRYTHAEAKANDWELEVLCDIAAAEILMPIGSFKPPSTAPASIDSVTALQRQFLVSTEAILLRIAKLTSQRCLIFAAHRDEWTDPPQYRIDYAIASRAWPIALRTGCHLPKNTVLAECTAIGFTAKSEEEWVPHTEKWKVECIGIAPFPGHVYPRVVGIVRPANAGSTECTQIEYLRGDATQPRGRGARIIAHVVNDKAMIWGKGFAGAVRRKWPHAQKDYANWILSNRPQFRAGNVRFATLEDSIELASLVAQHGYGPSLFPRIQYSALESCLQIVGSHAKLTGASIHIPRIGCGEAGGDWNIVSELIDQTLCRDDIQVTVYDLPEARPEAAATSSSRKV